MAVAAATCVDVWVYRGGVSCTPAQTHVAVGATARLGVPSAVLAWRGVARMAVWIL